MFNFLRAEKYKSKVFCIGLGKTGTTSINKVFKELGYKVGNQRSGENLIEDWAKRDFRRILKLSKTADAFQDVPFSLPFTYQALDSYYPNAKFVLTVRDSPEQWYNSLIRFHGKKWGKDGRIPPKSEDLKIANYIYQGRPFRTNKLTFNTPEHDPYNKKILVSFYLNHLNTVKNYFLHKNKMITINVSSAPDYLRLCSFLDKKPTKSGFPHLNKT